MTVKRHPDDMRPYPDFFYVMKGLALVTTLVGAIWTLDFYWPEKRELHTVTETGFYKGGRSYSNERGYYALTESDTIDLPFRAYNITVPGQQLVVRYTGLFYVFKGLEVHSKYGLEASIGPENRYTLNGFFTKFMLTSLFALLAVRPKYWMSALAWLNSVVALVFSGMEPLIMVSLVFLLAIILFIVTMLRQLPKMGKRPLS